MSDDYALSDIKTELATLRTQLGELLKRIDPLLSDHEKRLREVETSTVELRTRFRTWLTLASAVSAGSGGGLGVLLAHLTGA